MPHNTIYPTASLRGAAATMTVPIGNNRSQWITNPTATQYVQRTASTAAVYCDRPHRTKIRMMICSEITYQRRCSGTTAAGCAAGWGADFRRGEGSMNIDNVSTMRMLTAIPCSELITVVPKRYHMYSDFPLPHPRTMPPSNWDRGFRAGGEMRLSRPCGTGVRTLRSLSRLRCALCSFQIGLHDRPGGIRKRPS